MRTTWAAGALVAVMAAGGVAACGTGSEPPVVSTDEGRLRGVRADSVDSFLGVPYAAPPLGGLRWRPPQPAPEWSGVRPAEQYGNRCPALKGNNGPRSETEDCLFLNVQRPAGSRPGDRLPVHFWIHGGGEYTGSSNQHDGSKIVADAGVIVVTVNFRLGVFGFLGHPALTAETGESGNYGLQDQQAALRWVRENIAAFGGDRDRVTIGGESAGGWAVCAHLAAPGSRDLFVGAVIQSGRCEQGWTQAYAEATGSSVAASLGCTDPASALACLRGADAGRLLNTTAEQPFFVVGGTPTLPVDPWVSVHEGQLAKVPVLIGVNRDEGRLYTDTNVDWTPDLYEAWVRETYGPMADAILATYPWPAATDRFTGAYLTGAITTDSYVCLNRQLTGELARSTTVYAYEFAHRTGPGLRPEPAGYEWGAAHAAELPYLWPSFDNGTPVAPKFTAEERRLATEMVRYWGAHVRQGKPQVDGQVPWPAYGDAGQVLSLRSGGQTTVISDAEFVAEHHCEFWAAPPPAG